VCPPAKGTDAVPVLACDYDGTLPRAGHVDLATVDARRRLRETGRKTGPRDGRSPDDLFAVFPQVDLSERVVAENGAVLYPPGGREEKVLTDAAPEALVAALRHEGVEPLGLGRTVVSTRHPDETTGPPLDP